MKKIIELLSLKQIHHTKNVMVNNYLTADVNLAVASDNILMAASSSPSKPYKVITIRKKFISQKINGTSL